MTKQERFWDNFYVAMFFIGLILLISCAVLSNFHDSYEKLTYRGHVIDKYRGRTSSSDADGNDFYDDKFYIVVKYDKIPIERYDVSVNDYYNIKINDGRKIVKNGKATLAGYYISWAFFIGAFFIVFSFAKGMSSNY